MFQVLECTSTTWNVAWNLDKLLVLAFQNCLCEAEEELPTAVSDTARLRADVTVRLLQ